jgi:O-antigen/teichoic acid export membrane protein
MSIAKNYIYNLIYQVLNISLSIITVPYIARVLGRNGIGIQSFTDSLVQYFILFGTLGITVYYGSRTIAYVADDKEKAGKTFWEIFFLKLIFTSISCILFIAFIFFTQKQYLFICYLQVLNIVAAAVDISWFFMGMEDFKRTITANLFTRITGVCLIFTLVKNSDDVWKYVLIIASVILIGQMYLWIHLPRYVSFKNIKNPEIMRHLMPALSLLMPQLAIQVYVVMDRTLLGLLANVSQVGLYDVSVKLTKMSLIVISSMGVVMLPRIAGIFARGDKNLILEYINKSFNFSSYLAFPLALGIAAGAGSFVPWFYGKEFIPCITLLIILSPIIIALSWNNVTGIQLMLPLKKEKEFTISVCIGAAISFILNMILIPKYQALGAAAAMLVTECVVTFEFFIFTRKEAPPLYLLKDTWKYLTAAVVMAFSIYGIGKAMGPAIITTLTQVVAGSLVYVSMLTILKSETNRFLFGKALSLLKPDNQVEKKTTDG